MSGGGDPPDPPPISRQAGRWWGRWWRRHGDRVRATSRPARQGLATLFAYLWLLGYIWVGTIMAIGLQTLVRAEGPYTLLAGAGGGAVLGWWQSSNRLAKVDDPTTPAPRLFGLALVAWLAVIGLALVLDSR